MRLLIEPAVVVAIALTASGCATITTGTSQNIAIATDPAGADCTFTRNNQFLARVNPTPGAMHIDKSSADVSVVCKREGYQDTTGNIGSEFQAATLGNVILGGIIGIVIDAASGAGSKYPESISFTLLPVEFRSTDERDRFFTNMNTTFATEYAEIIARIKQSCQPADCESQLKTAESARTAHVASIERRRSLAKIRINVPSLSDPAISATVAHSARASSRRLLTRSEVESVTRDKAWEFVAVESGAQSRWEFWGSTIYGSSARAGTRSSGDWRLNQNDEVCVVWAWRQWPSVCVALAREGDRFFLMTSKNSDSVYAEVAIR